MKACAVARVTTPKVSWCTDPATAKYSGAAMWSASSVLKERRSTLANTNSKKIRQQVKHSGGKNMALK